VPQTKVKTKPHLLRHRDGSLWAKGLMAGEKCHGYWEWYRKDGSRMRSGHFDHGTQTGEWITYDRSGKVHKVTQFNPKTKIAKKR
jgi:antitoxin component YwqK of YwqJK toxin-antitoxin module